MSKSKHEKHDLICDHKIEYCKKCDTAYCVYNGCSAEWKEESCTQSHYPYTWYFDKSYYPYGNTWTTTTNNQSKIDTSDVQIYASGCAHD